MRLGWEKEQAALAGIEGELEAGHIGAVVFDGVFLAVDRGPRSLSIAIHPKSSKSASWRLRFVGVLAPNTPRVKVKLASAISL
jgi:hypothetical protein